MPSLLLDERNKFSGETSFFWLRSNSAVLTSRQLWLRFSDRNIDARWVCWKDFYQIFGRVSILLPKPENVKKGRFRLFCDSDPKHFVAEVCVRFYHANTVLRRQQMQKQQIYTHNFLTGAIRGYTWDCSIKSRVRGDNIKNIENLTRNKKVNVNDSHWKTSIGTYREVLITIRAALIRGYQLIICSRAKWHDLWTIWLSR